MQVIKPLPLHVFAWVSLVREFLDEGIDTYDWGVNEENLHTTYHTWDKKNFGWLLEDEGKIVGVLAGVAMPHFFNYSNWYFNESMFFVKPEYRKRGGGILLFRACVEQCKFLGIKRIVFGHTRVKAAELEQFFKKLGFTYLETHYEKVL